MAYTELITSALCKVTECSLSDPSRIEYSSGQNKSFIRNRLRTVAHREKIKLGNVPSATSRWPKAPSPTSYMNKLLMSILFIKQFLQLCRNKDSDISQFMSLLNQGIRLNIHEVDNSETNANIIY